MSQPTGSGGIKFSNLHPSAQRALGVTVNRVPTAAEVTAGLLVIQAPWPVKGVYVSVYDASGNTVKWDGKVTGMGTKTITVDNSGNVDWAATTPVQVVMRG